MRKIEVPQPGGNGWSHDADKLKDLDQYVHLCFRPNHPMEYAARARGDIAASVFLEVHPDVLDIEGVRYSPDVSNKSGVETFRLEDAIAKELIDFEVLYTRTDWKDPDIQARLRAAEKAELLIPRHIPLDLIRNLPDG